MQRVERERGAVSVMVALLIVALIGFTAIGIDVAATAADAQQLQNGADSAALAIGQDCAFGSCGIPSATAQTFAVANKNDGDVTATVLTSSLSRATGHVTVQAAGVTSHWFAPVLGIDQTAVTRRATVEWGAPAGGATAPLTFSECEWYAQTGTNPLGPNPPPTQLTVFLSKTSNAGGCNKPNSGNYVPGGFGFIDTIVGKCSAVTDDNNNASSSTGNTPPIGCSPADFQKLVASGASVLIPLFDNYGGTGTNAWYHISGYAAFKFTGYNFGGQYKTNPAPCAGNERCISGYFMQFVDASGGIVLDPNSTDFGALVIRLSS